MGDEGYTSELALLPLVASLVLSCRACEHHVQTFIPPPNMSGARRGSRFMQQNS